MQIELGVSRRIETSSRRQGEETSQCCGKKNACTFSIRAKAHQLRKCTFCSLIFCCNQDQIDGSERRSTLLANPSYQKMAIFPETREGHVYSSNESARGWSLREANVEVGTKGARMGKTQKGHCEGSFITNVLAISVLAISATPFSRRQNLLERTSTKISL